jgi:FkbM family methyltransferase
MNSKKLLKNLIIRINLFFHYIKNPKSGYIYLIGGTTELYESLNQDWFMNLKIATILDIGANTGQSTVSLSQLMPNAQIYAFEPILECFTKLRSKFISKDKVKTINLALGNSVGKINFEVNNATASSSILKMKDIHVDAFPLTKTTSVVEVNLDTLDNAVKNLTLNLPIMIKLDVQGYEKEVIAGGQKLFSEASIVIIESSFVELYQGQPLFDDIYVEMKLLGFKYMGAIGHLKDPRDGKILQSDSLFMK